ncbi:MAG: glycosyltransferase involved in cell wall biosynthesis [Cryomorphaceae bacterium]|jgi:glycosyltransferase involved in cell wall biosynthesis
MTERPFLSVITVSFNSAKTIGRTLDSLKSQSSTDFESVVIDGESTDGTQDIIRSFGDLVSIFVSEKDSGIYDAMNKGIDKSTGKYIAFLNSDDAYFPETIRSVRALANKVDASIIYGDLQKERTLGEEVLTRVERPDLELMPKTMGVFHPATFVKRELFEKFGTYDLRFKQAADYHWLLRAYMEKTDFQYLDKPLARFSTGGVSNFSCETYREAAIIQKELATGHDAEMEKLHELCLKKRKRNIVVSKLAEWPILRDIYRHKIKKRWN